jgi:hypothetical protein
MVTEETIKKTREFAENTQRDIIDKSSESLDTLKSSVSTGRNKYSILALRSVIARERNFIERRRLANPDADVSRQEDTLRRYTSAVNNLTKISTLEIDGPAGLDKTSRALQNILETDQKLRGARESSIQSDLRTASELLKQYSIMYGILDRIIENDDSSKRRTELDLLKRLKIAFVKMAMDTSELSEIIRLWEQGAFQTIIWMLKYGNVAHPKKNFEDLDRHISNSPPGTYVLLSTDLSNTAPEKLYTVNLNPDYAENNKENIYYWFRQRYPDMLNVKVRNGVPETKAWEEVRGLLELSGFGYVSKTEKETTRYGKRPKKIYDEDAFWQYYNEWKADWKKRLHMNEKQWLAYILKLDPYL